MSYLCTSYLQWLYISCIWQQIGGTLTFFHEEGARRCLEVMAKYIEQKNLQKQLTICLIVFIFHGVDNKYYYFQVSITLESSETVNRRFAHPSRRNSLTITKVDSLNLSHDTDMVEWGIQRCQNDTEMKRVTKNTSVP